MRVGFRFSKGGYKNGQPTSQKVTMWTTVPGTSLIGDAPLEGRHGKITQVTMSYADFEITECKITIQSPSEELVRQMLAVVVIEANPLDQALDLLDASVWIQDLRYARTPTPIFHGVILSLQMNDGPPDTLSITLLDFRRLQSIIRDVQDMQNLTDTDIAGLLMSQLSTAINATGDKGNALVKVEVDREALAAKQQLSSTGAVRRYMARLSDASKYEKLCYYAFMLGFKVTASVAKDDANGEAFTKLSFVPIDGETQLAAGTYRKGDGEVISFSRQYDPPGGVLSRDVNNKRVWRRVT